LLATLAAVVSGVDRTQIAWVTGAVLAGVVALTVALCVHAGGHVWLVPVPASTLAALWAVTVGSGEASGAVAWWLAGGTVAASGLAVVVALSAFGHPTVRIRTGADALRAAEGTALTALSPTGMVRVAGEPWTAESLSGPLPAGAPVHVVRVDGLRLLVWSEAGTVPGPEALEAEEGLE
jgi:membrane-bound ClpP family serine protease